MLTWTGSAIGLSTSAIPSVKPTSAYRLLVTPALSSAALSCVTICDVQTCSPSIVVDSSTTKMTSDPTKGSSADQDSETCRCDASPGSKFSSIDVGSTLPKAGLL